MVRSWCFPFADVGCCTDSRSGPQSKLPIKMSMCTNFIQVLCSYLMVECDEILQFNRREIGSLVFGEISERPQFGSEREGRSRVVLGTKIT